ncbi:Galactokinase [Portunus trituberculatus]|uniref:Galactokinase n=1 Tax=Portunus trituberculatus TaxID=210409 RepID=A0A5B7J510_PORTR|nr:Galactokinase [Portunus trituberculatus]
MACRIPEVASLVEEAQDKFQLVFGTVADVAVMAPGRVNIIGEHTDYNDGFVFPMALPMVTVVVGRRVEGGCCRVHTMSTQADKPHQVEFPAPSPSTTLQPGSPAWANYVKGVVANFPGIFFFVFFP